MAASFLLPKKQAPHMPSGAQPDPQLRDFETELGRKINN